MLIDPRLKLGGPPQNGFTPVPDVFSFKITSASSKFNGDTGTGFIVLELEPAAAPSLTDEQFHHDLSHHSAADGGGPAATI
jgi:hypothetical protein